MNRILILEDDNALRRVMTKILVEAGFEVTTTAKVQEALRAEGPFDILILDRILPDGDGLDVAKKWPTVSKIVISGLRECDLDKPFSMGDLLQLIYDRIAHPPSQEQP